ncbi:MAG: hypothetical protein H6708_23760 [Kofleriaceae bacterium]|nr:hypothetical protein [Kofleriaceae bacterium]
MGRTPPACVGAIGIALFACSSPHAPATGAASAPPRDDVPGDAAVAAAPQDAAPARELDCPAGATIVHAPPPARRATCAQPDGTLDGPFVERWPDGTIATTGRFAAGLLDGAWRRYHPGGALAEEGAWVAGKQDGTWRQLAADGTELARYQMAAGTGTEVEAWPPATAGAAPVRRREVTWKDGVRDGRSRAWDRDGTLVLDETWVAGALDGDRSVGSHAAMQIVEHRAAGVRTGDRTVSWRGRPVTEEHYDRAGRLHGAYVTWRDKRKPRERGAYHHGVPTGTWTWYGRSTEKEREGSYVDGERDGTWTSWKDGKPVQVGTWHAGKADGDFIEYDARGDELGRYAMTAGTGVALEWYASGKQARATHYKDGLRHGKDTAWSPRGTVVLDGNYVRGRRHGRWRERDPGGARLEARYHHGALDGAWRRTRGDGSVETEATYVAGARDGAFVERYPDGATALEGAFVADRKDGVWTAYRPDGSVSVRATWAAGVLDGAWQELDAGGAVVVDGRYAAGRRAGVWTWSAGGAVVRTETYAP